MSNVIAVINGPNLNLLGTREPSIYGSVTLADVINDLKSIASSRGFAIRDFQSNSEGAIIDEIQKVATDSVGIILNPGAYTHTSIAIRDACAACQIPIVEVHISNIYKREEFRHHSYISPVAKGVIAGFGVGGYSMALNALIDNNA